MITRRDFIKSLLVLFFFLLVPVKTLASIFRARKKHVTVSFKGCVKLTNPVKFEVEPDCTYREAIIKSKLLLNSHWGSGLIMVAYSTHWGKINHEHVPNIAMSRYTNIDSKERWVERHYKELFSQDENRGVNKDNISSIDIPKLDWKVRDNDYIILMPLVLGHGVPTYEDLRKERVNGDVALVRGKSGEYQEIWLNENFIIKEEPGKLIQISDFKLSSGLAILRYLCNRDHKKFSIPTDYKYPEVKIRKKDLDLLPGWRRKIFS